MRNTLGYRLPVYMSQSNSQIFSYLKDKVWK
jgi:hypothetical protein